MGAVVVKGRGLQPTLRADRLRNGLDRPAAEEMLVPLAPGEPSGIEVLEQGLRVLPARSELVPQPGDRDRALAVADQHHPPLCFVKAGTRFQNWKASIR